MQVLDGLPRSAAAISDFSPQIEETIEKGWLYASLMFQAARVRTGHLVIGMLKTADAEERALLDLARVPQGRCGEALRPVRHHLRIFHRRTGGRDRAAARRSDRRGRSAQLRRPWRGLAKFSIDLTEKARNGEIDQIVGRDAEIRQVIDILLRRRQNNPILTGEAGVGKTAVVEGFARRIVDGDVPPVLKDVTLRSLDIGLMQADASVKGEFEKRLRQVIDEVSARPSP